MIINNTYKTKYDIIRFTIIMAENVVTRYDPHFHLGMRVMTLIWCFRGWQVWLAQIKKQ